jgi:ABC-type polysaccharide/polyol phosphate transport system ATPase subunit
MKGAVEAAAIMVLVSHDVDLIASMCTRVIWMDKGRVLQDGLAKDVLALYAASSVAPTAV